MSKDFKRFFYKKTVVEEGDTIWRAWYLIDKQTREGVHFHGYQYKDSYENGDYIPWRGNMYRFSPHGIEKHRTKPIYKGQEPLKNCNVTGGDCYCDGTSLQASREFGRINPEKEDDYIWETLRHYYRIWIEDEDGDDR